jgi:mannose-6-phosphate isomerase-like protein (cupin superfamily)
VDDGAGLTIKELFGNIASKDDRISIAHVNISEPTSEPWLTIDYDEYLCVLSGCMILQHAGGELQVSAEQAVFIRRGERFRPTFPGR